MAVNDHSERRKDSPYCEAEKKNGPPGNRIPNLLLQYRLIAHKGNMSSAALYVNLFDVKSLI